MKTRRLGQTDLELTVVGLGTWAIGGSWQYGWGPQDDQDSIDAIFEAADCGINWIDTAPIYGCGHSEAVIGRALKQMSQKPIVATKCGLLWDEKREKVNCLDYASIHRECEDSLRRLGIETIDLYQMHWPEPNEQVEEAWGAMADLVRQGKVRHIGICNASVSQLQCLAEIYPPASLQPPYSILQRNIEKELIPYCGRNEIGIVAYSPMQKGLLTGKFTQEYLETLPPDDHRIRTDPNFSGSRFVRNLEIIGQLKQIVEEREITVAQLAVAWVLRLDEVTAAIAGARRKGQISETAAAGDITLDADTLEKIEQILRA